MGLCFKQLEYETRNSKAMLTAGTNHVVDGSSTRMWNKKFKRYILTAGEIYIAIDVANGKFKFGKQQNWHML